ncbi:MAG: NADPH-dependent assimilatory sulfite reductase flavoprotein subunit, partial [Enterobacteriaceae bacterium]
VAVLRYQVEQRWRSGGASGYLADRLPLEENARVYIETNDRFRLPAAADTPIIMIAAGTGIAPFRAFMQYRQATGATGHNWLLFGNPHFTEDFLYQVEWQRYVKSGLLNKIDLAWSRDQAEKEYVQHKLREQGKALWHWLQQGAHLYVCGDASRMAKDVEQALQEVIMQQGALKQEQANEYLAELRLNHRYQRDIY